LLGMVPRMVGNVASRFGASARNTRLADRLADPVNAVPGNPLRAGTSVQKTIGSNRMAEETPITAEYDRIFSGPLGQARRLEYSEGGHGQPIMTDEMPTQFTMQEGLEPTVRGDLNNDFTIEEPPTEFSVTEKGPTFATRHQRRSEALGDARAYEKSPDRRVEARRARAKAEHETKQMEQAAADNGLSMDEYRAANDAWGRVQQKFGNPFQNQIQGKKGSNFIQMLTNPRGWKSMRTMDPESGVKVMKDNPDLVKNLKEAVGDPKAWEALTTAVQKRIVRESTDPLTGEISAPRLAKKLTDMTDFGAHDLVPNRAELLEFAKTLDKYTRGPLKVPRGNQSLGVVDRVISTMGLDNALVTPDVGRKMAQARPGQKFASQRVAERTGQLGIAASQAKTEDRPGQRGPQRNRDIALPNPPARK
jgi:hypothetical protein